MLPEQTRRLKYLASAVFTGFLLAATLVVGLASVGAWDEEHLNFYEPWTGQATEYEDEVSSIHFDLVGALALAAGFSTGDAKTIQLYSQLTDSGVLNGSQKYSTTTQVTFPAAPKLADATPTKFCPSPTATKPELSMGFTDTIECPGCFTSRWGPWNSFFHFPHERPNELGAIRNWAMGKPGDALLGVGTYGYSSTARFEWQGVADIYATTSCFITQTSTMDTGKIQAGSLQSLGIYLHSLGDHWSHGACITAADDAGKPFAAHVKAGQNDPLAPCRWIMHSFEFGDPQQFPDSDRTFQGILAIYEALTTYAAQSSRPVYRAIPLHAEDEHLYNALYDFVHISSAAVAAPRRRIAEDLRAWALTTRESNPVYWRSELFLPLFLH